MATTSTTSAGTTLTAAQTTLSAMQAKRASAQKIVTALSAGSGVDVASLAQGLADAERLPRENALNTKISKNEARVSGYSAISFMLKGVKDALTALKDANSFNASTVTSANPTSFSATAAAGSAAGNYAVKVNSLAQAQRSMSVGFASAQTALNDGMGFPLNLSVNGALPTTLQIAKGSDTPQGVADAINAAKLGVKAQVVNTGEAGTPYKIVLTGGTGAAQSFKLFSPPVQSLRFASPDVALPPTLKLKLSINGQTPPVSLLDSANLPAGTTSYTPQTMAAAINSAGKGLSARLVYIGADGNPIEIAALQESDKVADAEERYRVVVTSTKTPPDDIAISSDPAGLDFLSPLRFTATQPALDASLTVDGVDYTRKSNTIDDVISGVTLDLKAPAAASAGLVLTRDTAQVKDKITALVTAYNEANEILNEVTNPKSTLDQYGATLVGDAAARQVKVQLREMMLGQSSSPGTKVGALWQMGISVDKSGVMAVDSAKLDAALTSNFADVVTTFTANQNNRSATSPPSSTSAGFASNLQTLNGGAAFSLTLTGPSGTVGIPVAADKTTPQGVVDAINASNAGYTAQLVNEGGMTPFKILVMGNVGGSNFSLSASMGSGPVSGLSFSSAGSGIAGDALKKISALLAPTGPMLSQSEGANAQNVKLKASLVTLQDRMQGLLERYTKQFATMESLVGNINSQKTSLKSSFEGMMAMYTNK